MSIKLKNLHGIYLRDFAVICITIGKYRLSSRMPDYSGTPSQIPACGFPAQGSSGLFALRWPLVHLALFAIPYPVRTCTSQEAPNLLGALDPDLDKNEHQ